MDTLGPFISALLIKVSLLSRTVHYAKVLFGTIAKCVNYASVLFKWFHCVSLWYNDYANRDSALIVVLGLHVTIN